jgi:hypothetical protein
MNVDIGTEAAQFLEKEYIKVIFVAVQRGPIYGFNTLRRRVKNLGRIIEDAGGER